MTPIPGFPEFVGVGSVDDVQFVMYDSDRKQLIPREQWMLESEGPESWMQRQELHSKIYLPILTSQSNQSEGIHTYQMQLGCELRDDGTRTAFAQTRWDGREFMTFDKDHVVWETPVHWGKGIQSKCNQNSADKLQCKHSLEVMCFEWLKKFLQYGQRELSVVTPVVSFTRPGGSNRLSCVVTGFYPQAIEVTLWRDGVMIDETLSSGILPNHDRTYQIRKWIEFDPEDQAEYSCRVEHSGLTETMVMIYVKCVQLKLLPVAMDWISQTFLKVNVLFAHFFRALSTWTSVNKAISGDHIGLLLLCKPQLSKWLQFFAAFHCISLLRADVLSVSPSEAVTVGRLPYCLPSEDLLNLSGINSQ
ncbi:major histocompatibility complex class I-related gene protein-like [Heterodontus francisci]|uniref:major histocompatibility complex class I-related gene protein-like n=1 Tax=Heterodontus francisci TaxID=7792 RepID=UPI00355B8030